MSAIRKLNVHECSFCRRSQHDVKVMVEGPRLASGFVAVICDECVDLCGEAVASIRPRKMVEGDL